MTGRSLRVRMAVIRVPFAVLKAAAKAAGGTLNDAYMAAVAGGRRRLPRGPQRTLPRHVRVNMPINVRVTPS